MVLLPPDAAAAERPPALRCQLRPPDPLPPELEARLRRQRAHQYGRHVREGLAAWHERHTARRQAQLAAQREQWEEQRAARLARLAGRQQAERALAAKAARKAQAEQHPADPLEALLAELLAAEGPGDPFSIINLFVAEQLELQAAQRDQQRVAAAAAAEVQSRRSVLGTAEATRQSESGRVVQAACKPVAEVVEGGPRPAISAAPELAQPPQQPGQQGPTRQAPTVASAAGTARPASAASNGENVPANVRHRRSCSMLLPAAFDVSAGQPRVGASGQLGTVPPGLLATAPAALQPAVVAASAVSERQAGRSALQLPPPAWPPQAGPTRSGSEPAHSQQPAGDIAPLPDQQHDSSKLLYVREWLQSAAQPSAPPSGSGAAPSVATASEQGQLDGEGQTAQRGSSPALSPQALAAPALTKRPASLPSTASARDPEEQPPLSAQVQEGLVSVGRLQGGWPGSKLGSQAASADSAAARGMLRRTALSELSASSAGMPAVDVDAVEAPAAARSPASSWVSTVLGGSLQSSLTGSEPAAQTDAREGALRSPAAAGPAVTMQQTGPGVAVASFARAAVSEERASTLGSDVEISYGEHSDSPSPASGQHQQGQRQEKQAQQALPPHQQAVAAAPAGGTPPLQSPRQQQAQLHPSLVQPRSPMHAADDRYPGSPPASPVPHHPTVHSPSGRPLSPASLGQVSQRPSLDGGHSMRPSTDGSVASRRRTADSASIPSRPGSPAGQHSESVGRSFESPSVTASSSLSACSSSVHSGDSPQQGSAGAAAAAAAAEPAGPQAAATAAAAGLDGEAEDGSPPGTPLVLSPTAGDAETCPGSAHVQDSTVVQTEEHARAYLAEVMEYFWAERAEGFAAGQVPPLGLEGYLAIERRRPACGDPQHIFNKLLFDAANEALASHRAQALDSHTGRLAPRLALLSRERIQQNVVERVLCWAAMGACDTGGAGVGSGGGDMAAMLAEDAAEEERVLSQMAGMLQAEVAAAAAAGGASGSEPSER
ncbi:hypothetical protein ABPG77_001825 [Micractinium sp. CCAP 211/92]